MKKTISDALARKGYDALTPVQEAVIEPEMLGCDLLVSAQTGSGKTIGFGLAIAPAILGDADTFSSSGAPLALVIAPTRELAMQVKRELGWLYADAGAWLASCVGGMEMRDERRALARGAHIVVATPGRLRDHITRGSIDLSEVRAVVLDEADEMLDLGFREDLEFILDETPTERQTLLFSATVPNAIATLAQRYQKDAKRISTVGEQRQHADIDYRAMMVAPQDEQNAIINVLRYYEAPNSIVFCNTRAMVARLTARLSNRGFSVVALSGEYSQSERSNALQAMRDGRARVCVATDVAARGIDLPNLDLVVHAELPKTHETLLHRSGRTGRAQRKGVSAMIVIPSMRKKAERLLKFAKLSATWVEAPGAEEVRDRDRARMFAADVWQTATTEEESASVDKLVETFSPAQLATAFLRQFATQHSAPEELRPVEASKPRAPADFGPSVWFSVSEGRKTNASPRHLLPMLCKAGDITRQDIGAIHIDEDLSYIEIREASVAHFLTRIGEDMKVEGNKDLVRLDAAPDLSGISRPAPKFGGKGKPNRPKGEFKPRKDRGPRPDHAPKASYKPQKADPASARTEDPAAKPRKPRQTKAPGPAPVKAPGAPAAHTKHKPAKGKPQDAKPGKPKPPKADAKDPGKKLRGDRPKGPPPPKGKASSKKNRARTALAKAAKGGNAPPKRRSS